ncbi:hypothetical protein AXF42_Ash012700 [Apostasia shenzhenica]|uniref:Uncharacterized protein n=1 Tax=Apostasia shenzhenica TaxID=1088818 RepID=A0A2H9ZTF0_9ASPA|nr:hypothetical protein AXF42_Ash012700 [Apostasia shenzhenica]
MVKLLGMAGLVEEALSSLEKTMPFNGGRRSGGSAFGLLGFKAMQSLGGGGGAVV